jgi:hypothetical protein
MSALEALAAAHRAGVTITLIGEDIFIEPSPPAIVAQFRAVKADLLRILVCRGPLWRPVKARRPLTLPERDGRSPSTASSVSFARGGATRRLSWAGPLRNCTACRPYGRKFTALGARS